MNKELGNNSKLSWVCKVTPFILLSGSVSVYIFFDYFGLIIVDATILFNHAFFFDAAILFNRAAIFCATVLFSHAFLFDHLIVVRWWRRLLFVVPHPTSNKDASAAPVMSFVTFVFIWQAPFNLSGPHEGGSIVIWTPCIWSEISFPKFSKILQYFFLFIKKRIPMSKNSRYPSLFLFKCKHDFRFTYKLPINSGNAFSFANWTLYSDYFYLQGEVGLPVSLDV